MAELLQYGAPEYFQELDRQVRRFVGDLERHCLAAPLQWFNFYDFWQQDTQEP